MKKQYAILQKKLHELEAQLSSLAPTQFPQHDIEQKLEFLNTLYSAELASNPQSHHHLHHIRRRIALIESALRERSELDSETAPFSELDSVSDCSCTESCLNEEDGVVGSEEKIGELKKERVRVRGLATAIAAGFFIGVGFSGFVMLQWSGFGSETVAFVPT